MFHVAENTLQFARIIFSAVFNFYRPGVNLIYILYTCHSGWWVIRWPHLVLILKHKTTLHNTEQIKTAVRHPNPLHP